MTKNIDPRPQALIEHDRRVEVIAELSWMIAEHGDHHPATWAALGRAFIHWRHFVRPPGTPHPDFATQARLNAAYTTAQVRELLADGYDNRRQRRERALRTAEREEARQKAGFRRYIEHFS